MSELTSIDQIAETTSATTSGMTKKVFKGTFWVLIGQILPLAATFVATPFVIRYLGSEAYGVLILIGLISTYFTFGDLGMGLASTKFGSEAYAEGSASKEATFVYTGLIISLVSSLLIATPIFIFSGFIVRNLLNIPSYLEYDAVIGLRLTSIAFVFGILTAVINTPQLSRLRMDLNILTNAGGKILMILVTPVILYAGGGIMEACVVSFTASILIFMGNAIVSARLQPQLFKSRFDHAAKNTLLKFGKDVALYSAAFILIFNAEKFVLSKLTSPKELAYYSVAYTFANMTTMFTLAIGQTLLPAFSQMLAPEKKQELDLLFNRSFKGSLLLLLPSIMLMLVIAKPFFRIWAGPDFGSESIYPFYILMGGIFFSLLMYIPNSVLLAFGRTKLFAKTYWLEIIPYIFLSVILIKMLGILGAAAVWSIREFVNAFIFFGFSKKYAGVKLNLLSYSKKFFIPLLLLIPPVFYSLQTDGFSPLLIFMTTASLMLYMIMSWRLILSDDERRWMLSLITFLPKNKKI